MLASLHILDFSSQEYTPTLAIRLRLHNISSSLPFLLTFVILPKLRILFRQHPSHRKEIILIRKPLTHIHQIIPQQILPSYHMNPRKMINLLKQMHFNQHIRIDTEISPVYIPITRIITCLNFPA